MKIKIAAVLLVLFWVLAAACQTSYSTAIEGDCLVTYKHQGFLRPEVSKRECL